MLIANATLRWGLELAWSEGWRAVDANVDSACVADAVNKDNAVGWLAEDVLHDIKSLLSRDWIVSVSHWYREGNRVADALANLGLDVDFRSNGSLFRAVPPEISGLVEADIGGQASVRAVPV